jgi:hypothetical protein
MPVTTASYRIEPVAREHHAWMAARFGARAGED